MSKDFTHIIDMEKVFDEILEAQDSLEKAAENYKSLQVKVKKLERYYSGKQWKEDYSMDERGEIPADVKRGVLSEDGIYNMLERNREIMELIGKNEDEYLASAKTPTYHEVVKRAQAAAKIRGEYGNKDVILYPCKTWLDSDQINLWSYWQGYQYKDIDEKGVDILLVGQDWGNPEKDEKTIAGIEAIQAGKSNSFYNDHASITDINLKELFKCFGCDIEKADPGQRLLFTNYSLGYRKGSEQGGMTKTLLQEDKSFFDDLVRALNPKIIICLGKITFEAVTGEKVLGFIEKLRTGKPLVAHSPVSKNIKVYGVAHCGALGANNVGGMPIMLKMWKVIAKDYQKICGK